MNACRHVQARICTNMCMYERVCSRCVCVYVVGMHVCMHARVCVYVVGMHVCVNARVCVCVYVVGMHVCYAWHA